MVKIYSVNQNGSVNLNINRIFMKRE